MGNKKMCLVVGSFLLMVVLMNVIFADVVPSAVLIKFKDNVSYIQAEQFLKDKGFKSQELIDKDQFNQNITPEKYQDLIKQLQYTYELNFPDTIYGSVYINNETGIEPTKENLDMFIKKIKEKDTENLIVSTGIDSKQIYLRFIGTNKNVSDIVNFLSQFKELNKSSFNFETYNSRIGTIYIPNGDEDKWIDNLKKESIVEYAQKEYVYSTQSISEDINRNKIGVYNSKKIFSFENILIGVGVVVLLIGIVFILIGYMKSEVNEK